MTYNFGERLMDTLHRRGLTTRVFQERTGISRRAIHYWKNGKYPPVHVLILIADELEVSTDYLLGVGDGERLLRYALDESSRFGKCDTCQYGVSFDGRRAVCRRQDDGVFPKEDGSCWAWHGWQHAEQKPLK